MTQTTSCGNDTQCFSLRQANATAERLVMLFRLNKESIYLTTDANEVIFTLDGEDKFPYLYNVEYFVNGDPITTSSTTYVE